MKELNLQREKFMPLVENIQKLSDTFQSTMSFNSTFVIRMYKLEKCLVFSWRQHNSHIIKIILVKSLSTSCARKKIALDRVFKHGSYPTKITVTILGKNQAKHISVPQSSPKR